MIEWMTVGSVCMHACNLDAQRMRRTERVAHVWLLNTNAKFSFFQQLLRSFPCASAIPHLLHMQDGMRDQAICIQLLHSIFLLDGLENHNVIENNVITLMISDLIYRACF